MRNEYPNLPLIEERFRNILKETDWADNVKYPEFEVRVFLQTWGSTALGFGGIGGQAFTSAYTTVIWDEQIGYGVFFAGCFAYAIREPNDLFFEHLLSGRMESVARCGVYRKENSEIKRCK